MGFLFPCPQPVPPYIVKAVPQNQMGADAKNKAEPSRDLICIPPSVANENLLIPMGLTAGGMFRLVCKDTRVDRHPPPFVVEDGNGKDSKEFFAPLNNPDFRLEHFLSFLNVRANQLTHETVPPQPFAAHLTRQLATALCESCRSSASLGSAAEFILTRDVFCLQHIFLRPSRPWIRRSALSRRRRQRSASFPSS